MMNMRIVMMGTGTFAEPTFSAIISAREQVVGLITQPDRDIGRKSSSSRLIGKNLVTTAFAHNIPISQPENINTPEGIEELRAFAPDLVVVAAYGQILKPQVIALPKFGFINVHASLLPKYRGAAPVAYAILKGEKVTGVTIIRITPGLDSGNILAQETVEILPDETTGELEARLAIVGSRLTLDVIQKLKHGLLPGTPQDSTLVTKAPKIPKEMGLIDFTKPAEEIRWLIRAMQPWPTAFTYLQRPNKESMRLILCKTGRIEVISTELPAGTLTSSPFPFGVVTGNHQVLEILELQPAGKKRMRVEEFIRGYPIQPGYILASG